MTTTIERKRRRTWWRVGLGTVAAVAMISLASWQSGAAVPHLVQPATALAAPAPPAPGSYSEIVDRVAPAVVAVHAERTLVNPTSSQFPGLDSPLFQRFFGDQLAPRGPQAYRQYGLGSGVIVSDDGYIITNHHVVDGATEIKVELPDHRMLEATLIGSDPASDLAVLRIDAHDISPIAIGDSDAVRVGDVALAIGNPLGVGETVTMGIVSAKGRTTDVSDGSYEDFIQTDAPINQGNSGGALVNTRGQLIGINSQILSPNGGNIGIGFAVPSNLARHVMQQLITDGTVHRGRLGVSIQTVTSDLARGLGLDEVQGVITTGVEPNGPADKAGLRRGDVITSYEGRPVEDANSLRNEVADTAPGTQVTLGIERDGRSQQMTATLAELTPSAETPDGGAKNPEDAGVGMTVAPLTPSLAERFGLESEAPGLVVTDVDPTGEAAARGIRPGDVIETVNGTSPATVASLRSALRNTDRPALVLVARGDEHLYVALEAARG